MYNKKLLSDILVVCVLLYSVSAITDTNQSNNNLSVLVNVSNTDDFVVTFVPIDEMRSTYPTVVQKNIELINRTYPTSDTEFIPLRKDVIHDSNIGSQLNPIEEIGVLYDIYRSNRLSLGTVLSGSIFADRVVGIVPDGWFAAHGGGGTQGYAISTPIFTFRGVIIEEDERHLAAHELGHTFGLCDEYNNDTWANQDIFLGIPGFCPNGDLNQDDKLDINCYGGNAGCPTSTQAKLVPFNTGSGSVDMLNFMGFASAE